MGCEERTSGQMEEFTVTPFQPMAQDRTARLDLERVAEIRRQPAQEAKSHAHVIQKPQYVPSSRLK